MNGEEKAKQSTKQEIVLKSEGMQRIRQHHPATHDQIYSCFFQVETHQHGLKFDSLHSNFCVKFNGIMKSEEIEIKQNNSVSLGLKVFRVAHLTFSFLLHDLLAESRSSPEQHSLATQVPVLVSAFIRT